MLTMLEGRQSFASRFLAFCIVGLFGFVADVSITLFLNRQYGLSPTESRCVAIGFALISTFLLNHYVTFSDRIYDPKAAFFCYFMTQFVGSFINFLAYSWILFVVPETSLFTAIVFGSAIALFSNYFLAERVVFSDPGPILRISQHPVSLIMVATVSFLWPAWMNGAPFIFFDTSHYISLGKSVWTHAQSLLFQDPSALISTRTASGLDHAALTYAGGRSPFYSFPTFLSANLGLWPQIFFQSFAAALTIYSFATLFPRSVFWFLLFVAIGGLFTPLPFFSSFVMPDIFAGIMLLGIISLFFFENHLSNFTRIWLNLIIAYSASTHASNLIIGYLLYLFFFVTRAVNSKVVFKPMIKAGLPFFIATILLIGFNQIVHLRLGSAMRAPPYFTARLLADGAGREYLNERCGENEFALCKYRDRQFTTQDEFLWSGEPNIGVFSIAPLSDRELIKNEEFLFAWNVFLYKPVEVVQSILKNSVDQFFSFGVVADFSEQKNSFEKMNFEILLGSSAQNFVHARVYNGDLFFSKMDRIIYIVSLLSLLILIISLPFLRKDARLPPLFLLFALVVNAILCGAVSGVNDRYQARIIWLVPLFAAMNIAPMWRKLSVNFNIGQPKKS